jgi:hypothetical protein
MTKFEMIRAFREFDQDRVIGTSGGIVLGQLSAKATGLDANGRVRLRIEIRWPAEDLRCYLVLLYRLSGMIDCLLGEVTEKLTQRLRTVKDATAGQAVYLPQELVFRENADTRNGHVTTTETKVTNLETCCKCGVCVCNGIKRLETSTGSHGCTKVRASGVSVVAEPSLKSELRSGPMAGGHVFSRWSDSLLFLAEGNTRTVYPSIEPDSINTLFPVT